MLCQACGYFLPNTYHSKVCQQIIKLKCKICDKVFSKMKYLQNHEKVHDYQIFKCKFCTKQLSTKSNLNIHIKLCHRSCTYFEVCEVCKAKFKRKSDLTRHKKKTC